jgi:hypothetical protein
MVYLNLQTFNYLLECGKKYGSDKEMPLKDDEFSKINKPEEYLNIIEELHEEKDSEVIEIEYDLDIDEEEE